MQHSNKAATYKEETDFINGLPDFTVTLKEHIKVNESSMVQMAHAGSDGSQKLNFVDFPPGSAVAVR